MAGYESLGSRELKSLLKITEAVTGTLDVREVMQRVVREVGAHVGADRCSILLVDEGSDRCFVLAANDNPEIGLLSIDLHKYPEVRRALRTRETVMIEDVRRDPVVAPVRKELTRLGYRSLLVVPLLFGREVLGTMFLRANRKVEPFSREEVRFCRVAAGTSANALKNALLYGDVAAEAERHRATSETLRRVLDGTPDLIVATDAAGLITEFNHGAQEVTGLSAEQARGRHLDDVLGDALRRAGLAVVQRHRPDAIAVALDDGMGAAVLERLVREQRRVDAAVDDVGAALARGAADFIASQRVEGVNADPDDVARGHRRHVDLFERLVDDLGIAIGSRGGRR